MIPWWRSDFTIGGVGIGSILAAALSYHSNHDPLYAILHFFLSWIYVVYWALEHLR